MLGNLPQLLIASAAHVSTGTTVLFAGLLIAMIAALALEERLHAKKSLITGVFAIICLFLATWLRVLPYDDSGKFWLKNPIGETLHLPIYIPGIDWGVIAIILGSSLFVDVVSKSGLFTYLAIRLTKASRGDPVRSSRHCSTT